MTTEDRSASVDAREFTGPLRQIRREVPGSGGWIVVAHEKPDGLLRYAHVWIVSAVHPNHGWNPSDGLPFKCARIGPLGYTEARDATSLESAIARFERSITAPLYPNGQRFRDYTCPHCKITERDGNENTDGEAGPREGHPGKVCRYCRRTNRGELVHGLLPDEQRTVDRVATLRAERAAESAG